MGYTDLTSEFDYKDLLTYQNMDLLAENDAYAHIVSGSVMTFFQASAPTGWVKQTAVTDAFLRVVSGSGGGNAGTLGLSTGMTLQHNHTDYSHTHSNAHQHQLDHGAASPTSPLGNQMISSNSSGSRLILSNTGSATVRRHVNETQSGDGGTSGSTSPTLDNQLTDTTFQYIDVIVCEKT